jgi:Cof subfamily protein (haloacid dehalogenase superfamily)
MIRLLAIDIDGTLLDSSGRVPQSHRLALAEAADRGIALALVTGRSFHFTRPLAGSLGVPLTLIVNNGAVVKDAAGRTLLRHLLPRDAAREVLASTLAYEDSVALVFDRGGSDEDAAREDAERQIVFERMDWSHPNRRGYFEKNKAYIATASPLVDALSEDPIQVMFNGGIAPMRTLAAELRALPIADRYSVALTEYEARDFSLLDVNAAGCSKGATLAKWAQAQGIPPEDVMAVGDNLNDLDMLQFAGVGVVMGNAAESVKARGYPVTATNDEGGLADAIRRYALDRPAG